jgi:hypothetical protein
MTTTSLNLLQLFCLFISSIFLGKGSYLSADPKADMSQYFPERMALPSHAHSWPPTKDTV